MPISSSSLFHFTSGKLDAILGILENGYRVSYTDETTFSQINNEEESLRKAIPMVCFCDIPISLVESHANFYSVDEKNIFGFGMTKRWAESNGLNPVIYISPESYLSRLLASIENADAELQTTIRELDFFLTTHQKALEAINLGSELRDLQKRILDTSIREKKINMIDLGMMHFSQHYTKLDLFLKPTSGKYLRGKKLIENHNFYNEREWRYVPEHLPDIRILSSFRQFLDGVQAFNVEQEVVQKWHEDAIHHYNVFLDSKNTYKENITFSNTDVSFIIVNNDHSAKLLIEQILDPNFSRLSAMQDISEQVKIDLISKIISWEKITKDILTN